MEHAILYKGRILGIVVFVAIQVLIGVIHVFSGVLLLLYGSITTPVLMEPLDIYSIYTLLFGLLILFFTYGIWVGKRWGWIGTVAISVLVILVDSLTVLNLPSIPGIPKIAALFEIIYSLLILIFISQTHIRGIFLTSRPNPASQ